MPDGATLERGVTIVTQTRIRPGAEEAFARWQQGTSAAIARAPGFVEQSVIPPSPPVQVDWVILQRFARREDAASWLDSDERRERLAAAQSFLVGGDDIHLVADGGAGLPAPASAVISTRVKPGREAEYRAWEKRIAAAQAKAPGFQGYRFEPPVPGLQEDWLAILRFDSEASLQAWLDSPARMALVEEARPFTEEFHARVARTGFDQWFAPAGAAGPPAWKQNMIVLLLLYPIVVLFGALVQTPILMRGLGLPFPVALFVGNVVSILILNYLVPWTNTRLAWWLRPGQPADARADGRGAALLIGLYVLLVGFFTVFL